MKDSKKIGVWVTSPSVIKDIEDGRAPYYTLEVSDMSAHGWVKICDAEVSFDRPDVEPLRQAFICNLKNQRTKIYAEAQMQCNKIDETINNLLAVGWNHD
jgi:hypothetical protein